MHIERRGKRFLLYVGVDEAECQRRQEREERDRAATDAMESARRTIDELPKSAREYASDCLNAVELFAKYQRGIVHRSGGGYRFDDEAVKQFEEALQDAVAALKGATVTFDPAGRARRVAMIRHGAAAADAGFQGQLAAIRAGTDSAKAAD